MSTESQRSRPGGLALIITLLFVIAFAGFFGHALVDWFELCWDAWDDLVT